MKTKLEADLISIAHRILQLENKSDINQLYLESQKVYEKLAILRFVDELSIDTESIIQNAKLEDKMESYFSTETSPEFVVEVKSSENETENLFFSELQTKSDSTIDDFKEEVIEIIEDEEVNNDLPIPESISDTLVSDLENEKEESSQIVAEVPNLEILENKEYNIETNSTKQPQKAKESLEDILGNNFRDLQFIKKPIETENTLHNETVVPKKPERKLSLNDKLSKKITVDLNDQIAFTKHLFLNSFEDYNRVLNQLITFNEFREALDFIENIVKPDYNNWEGKEEYVVRFMNIIEKKFL